MDRQNFEEHIEELGQSMQKVLDTLGGVDPRVATVCMQMLDTMRQLGKYQSSLLAKTGLPAAQAGGLLLIGVYEGISQRELSKKLGIASSSSTVMLQRMEKSGLIERKSDDQDQRILHVYLSDKGRQCFLDVKRTFADFINSIFGGISERGMLAMQTVIEELAGITGAAQASDKSKPHANS